MQLSRTKVFLLWIFFFVGIGLSVSSINDINNSLPKLLSEDPTSAKDDGFLARKKLVIGIIIQILVIGLLLSLGFNPFETALIVSAIQN